MKKTSIIINTSRGPIIKEKDLITALNNKTISDEKFIISKELINQTNFIKLSIGKKKHYKIVF